MLEGETLDTRNAKARVRLCDGTIAGHRNKGGTLDEDPEEMCARGKTGNRTWPISLSVDICVDRRTTGFSQSVPKVTPSRSSGRR